MKNIIPIRYLSMLNKLLVAGMCLMSFSCKQKETESTNPPPEPIKKSTGICSTPETALSVQSGISEKNKETDYTVMVYKFEQMTANEVMKLFPNNKESTLLVSSNHNVVWITTATFEAALEHTRKLPTLVRRTRGLRVSSAIPIKLDKEKSYKIYLIKKGQATENEYDWLANHVSNKLLVIGNQASDQKEQSLICTKMKVYQRGSP